MPLSARTDAHAPLLWLLFVLLGEQGVDQEHCPLGLSCLTAAADG